MTPKLCTFSEFNLSQTMWTQGEPGAPSLGVEGAVRGVTPDAMAEQSRGPQRACRQGRDRGRGPGTEASKRSPVAPSEAVRFSFSRH